MNAFKTYNKITLNVKFWTMEFFPKFPSEIMQHNTLSIYLHSFHLIGLMLFDLLVSIGAIVPPSPTSYSTFHFPIVSFIWMDSICITINTFNHAVTSSFLVQQPSLATLSFKYISIDYTQSTTCYMYSQALSHVLMHIHIH